MDHSHAGAWARVFCSISVGSHHVPSSPTRPDSAGRWQNLRVLASPPEWSGLPVVGGPWQPLLFPFSDVIKGSWIAKRRRALL